MLDLPPQLVMLARRFLSAIADIGKALQNQAEAIAESTNAANEKQNVRPEVVAELRAPQGIEIRKSADEAANDKKYQFRTLLISWLAFSVSVATLLSLIAYAYISGGQLHEMRKATKAATDAVEAAQQANTDARERFREDERPYIWFTVMGNGTPEFRLIPNANPPIGQIVWSWHYTDYGKTPAYGIQFVREEIKIGGRPFKIMYQQAYRPGIGTLTPPGKDDFASIPSDSGITPQEFARLLQIDRSILIRVRMDYADASGAIYETAFANRASQAVLQNIARKEIT